jgi:cellulose biosynthesis protein BcsQ
MGGSGKSTFTASLGGILWRLGRRVLLVDTSPWQVLAFHYGAADARPGKRSFFAPGAQELPVHILAWDHHDAGIPDLNSFSATTPLDCVLFDLGGVAGETLLAYFRECDILVVPLLPDSSAVRLAESLKALIQKAQPSPRRVMFVINQMDDSSQAKEVREHLSQSLGDQLLPTPILRQPEIQQALAEGFVLPYYAPEAQAVSVYNEIAQWLKVPEATAVAKKQQRWSER